MTRNILWAVCAATMAASGGMVSNAAPRVVEDTAHLEERQAEDVINDICRGRPVVLVGGQFLSDRMVDWVGERISSAEAQRRLDAIEIAHEAIGPTAGFYEKGWRHALGPHTLPGGMATLDADGGSIKIASGGELWQWDNNACYPAGGVYAPGETLFIMEARSDYEDAQASIELNDAAGGRWFATVDVGLAWRRYVIPPTAFKGDRPFVPSKIVRICLGVSQQYTPRMTDRKSSFHVRRVGSAPAPVSGISLGKLPYDRFPAVEGVWPPYKVCRLPGERIGMFDRPCGEGYGRGGPWRLKRGATPSEWILLERRPGKPERCIACFGYGREEDRNRPDVRRRIAETCELFERGTILFEGGTRHFSYRPGEEVTLGASWRGPARDLEIVVENAAGEKVFSRKVAASGLTDRYETAWLPAVAGCYTVRVAMAGDSIRHQFAVAAPHVSPKDEFVTVHDGDFWLKGGKWYAVGVNFWPRYSLGTEPGDYWNCWLKDGYYTPSLIQRDLELFASLGGNMVSIQACPPGHERNMLDFFRRCRALDIHVNLWAPWFSPMAFDGKQAARLIAEAEIAGDATVFAFDMIWEPGNSLFRDDAARSRFDAEWREWIDVNYGDVARAEKDWGVPCRRDAKGMAISPPTAWFAKDGAWRRQMAAYRRFMDNATSKRWNIATGKLRALAPNTLVSFRQGNTLPHDFALTGPVRHLDFVCPEGYSYPNTQKGEAAIGWTTRFIDAWSGGKPVIWSEFGFNAWNEAIDRADPALFAVSTSYAERFYRTGIAAGANGTSPWWWPGGFRKGENSDYGIVNPDGTLRPMAELMKRYAPSVKRARDKPSPDVWIDFDRDAHAGGYWAAAFGQGAAAYADAVAGGHMPGVRIAGMGMTSADCPGLALGDVPCDGTNPPKFLDSEIDRLETVPLACGGRRVKAVFGNVGMATWLPGSSGVGGVALVVRDAKGREVARRMLARRVERFAATEELVLDVTAEGVKCRLEATGRFPFGAAFGLPRR